MTNLELIFEDWTYIPKYEGVYIISTRGRVKSLDKFVNCWNGPKWRKGRLVKSSYQNNGYTSVELNHKGKSKRVLVHSLVLLSFEGQRPKGYVGMHLNDIKDDNRRFNLKWGTQSENVKDSYSKGNATTVNDVKVIAVNLSTRVETIFSSIADARRTLNVTNVHKILNGERPHSRNYWFKRA